MTAPHMPMMNDEGLLECPFCGNSNVYADTNGKSYFVWCDNCGCGTGDRITVTSAVRKWNTRNGNMYTKQDFAESHIGREIK